MRIFAFRSFRAAAPGLMEFTQQQRCLFICLARPASPSISICFSGQGSSFSSINMHFVEFSGTRAQSGGWSIRIVCTYAHLHAKSIFSSFGLHKADVDSWTAVYIAYVWLHPTTCIRTLDCFGITSREVYLWCSSKVVSLDVSRILTTQSWKA